MSKGLQGEKNLIYLLLTWWYPSRTWKSEPEKVRDAVIAAVRAGYR